MWRDKLLTGNFQGRIGTPRHSEVVGGHAPVDAGVLLLLALHRSQEEQGSVGKKNPVGLRILRSGTDERSIPEPFNDRIRASGSLTSERDGFVSCDGHVDRILQDPWHRSDRDDGRSSRRCWVRLNWNLIKINP